MGKNKTGQSGKNLIIHVPQGTQIYTNDKKSLIADLKDSNKLNTLLKN